VPEAVGILDTEPVVLEARGGSGEILWSSDNRFEGLFSPDTGRQVVFTPPDLSFSATVTVTATDRNLETARADVLITDQGGPPRPGEVLVNEIAWAGTLASSTDEYLELLNTGERPLYLKNWSIDNAKGAGKPLAFSGRVEGFSFFLIANYSPEHLDSAIRARVDRVDAGLSLSNSLFGPYVLRDGEGRVLDTVGDGAKPRVGLNAGGSRASASRFPGSNTTDWDEASWYTEGLSANLGDGTFGTPGAANSGTPYAQGTPPGPGGGDAGARAVISEFSVGVADLPDAGAERYWVELFVTRAGNVKDFVVTDLDGSDSSISGGVDELVGEGDFLLVVWGGVPGRVGNTFCVQDQRPTAVRDELVLLAGAEPLDALCFSTDGRLPDDYGKIAGSPEAGGFGWEGEPVRGARGSRVTGEDGAYLEGRGPASWDTESPASPGGNPQG
jgi:hypothetical protein